MRTIAIVSLLFPLAAAAQEECPPVETEIDGHRTLRALSLDLRGNVPTVEEYDAVDSDGEVPEEVIDEWLASEEFLTRAVRFHRDLLWNNIDNVSLTDYRGTMGRTDPEEIYWRGRQAVLYRGDEVPCLDQEAEFGPDGLPIAYLQGDTTWREGWVWVEPYWYPGTLIKVCAFDAQDGYLSPTGTHCDRLEGYNDAACGCGPSLAWCRYGYYQEGITQGLAQDVDRRIESVLRDGRTYLDLFTGRQAFVNGPTVHFWKHQTGIPANVELQPVPVPVEQLPDLDFTETDEWIEIQLGEEHAGILTSPAYLLRFQTNRARANRYYNAFMCQPFQPPVGGLPAPGESVPVLDLQVRDGCKYCHGLLEPSASYWGRWAQGGGGFLDPVRFPAVRDDCALCAATGSWCSEECRDHYVVTALTPEEDPYLGWLRSYEFRRPEHVDHIEDGPAMLALRSAVDGRLQGCSAKNAARWLLGRETLPDEDPWVDELGQAFVDSEWDWKALVKAIVTSPVYGRVQ